MEKDKIFLNYANCIADILGPRQGIDKVKLKEFEHEYRDARMKIVSKKNTGKLGFADMLFDKHMLLEIKKLARTLKGAYRNLVIVGIGGSALGNRMLQSALNHPFWNLLDDTERKKYPKLFIVDNIDPDLLQGLCDVLDFKKTLFNVISKSGSTAECLANYSVLRKVLEKKVGKKYIKQIVITTDPEKGYLREYAKKEGIQTLAVPTNVGGRFSVLSAVGLFSAALTGIDVDSLVEGARDMYARCDTNDMQKNIAAMFAVLNYMMYQADKKICVCMPYAHGLYDCADWFRQLWAESLGKRVNLENIPVHVGPTPVKALGVTDQHSQLQLYVEGPYDKIIVFLSVEKSRHTVAINAPSGLYLKGQTLNKLFKAEERATRIALTKSERPNMTIILPEVNAYTLGQLILMFELATAYMGEFFHINAFDQPGVELGKQYTSALLGRKGFEAQKRELEVFIGGEKRNKGKSAWSFIV